MFNPRQNLADFRNQDSFGFPLTRSLLGGPRPAKNSTVSPSKTASGAGAGYGAAIAPKGKQLEGAGRGLLGGLGGELVGGTVGGTLGGAAGGLLGVVGGPAGVGLGAGLGATAGGVVGGLYGQHKGMRHMTRALAEEAGHTEAEQQNAAVGAQVAGLLGSALIPGVPFVPAVGGGYLGARAALASKEHAAKHSTPKTAGMLERTLNHVKGFAGTLKVNPSTEELNKAFVQWTNETGTHPNEMSHKDIQDYVLKVRAAGEKKASDFSDGERTEVPAHAGMNLKRLFVTTTAFSGPCTSGGGPRESVRDYDSLYTHVALGGMGNDARRLAENFHSPHGQKVASQAFAPECETDARKRRLAELLQKKAPSGLATGSASPNPPKD